MLDKTHPPRRRAQKRVIGTLLGGEIGIAFSVAVLLLGAQVVRTAWGTLPNVGNLWGWALIVAGVGFSTPTAIMYHVRLAQTLRPRGMLDKNWIWHPTRLHELLTAPEKKRVLFWFRIGALGWSVAIVGLRDRGVVAHCLKRLTVRSFDRLTRSALRLAQHFAQCHARRIAQGDERETDIETRRRALGEHIDPHHLRGDDERGVGVKNLELERIADTHRLVAVNAHTAQAHVAHAIAPGGNERAHT